MHNWGDAEAFDLWADWSGTSAKYTLEACKEKWATFTGSGGRTIRTAFRLALDNGWKPDPVPVMLKDGKPIGTNGSGHGATGRAAELIGVLKKREEILAAGQPPTDGPITLGDLIDRNPKLRPVVIEGLLRVGETMNVIASRRSASSGPSWTCS